MIRNAEFKERAPDYFDFLARRSKYYRHANFFALCVDVPFDVWLQQIADTALNRQKSGCKGPVTHDGEFLRQGKEFSESIYVQDSRTRVSRGTDALFNIFDERVSGLLQIQGWISQILIKGSYQLEKLHKCWPRLLSDHGLVEVLVNQERRKRYQITDSLRKGCKIAVRREEE